LYLNLHLLRPEICLAITAIAVIAVDLFSRRKWLVNTVSLVGLLVSIVLAISLVGSMPNYVGNGLFVLDNYAVFFKILFIAIAILVVLVSTDYIERIPKLHGEYHALLLTATLGAMLTAAAQNIISVILSVELTAVSLYALVGMLKNEKSTESSLKYLLLGAVNSAVMLFGLALVFGFTGSTNFSEIAEMISKSVMSDGFGLFFGLALVFAGFAFKIAAVPFHMWAPDVYEGSPTPITLFLSTVSKIAGFSILLRLVIIIVDTSSNHTWGMLLAIISAVTMTTGNLLAISQNNIKRLLAYSSIAQSGYMLMAVAAVSVSMHDSLTIVSSLQSYMVAFALAEIAVFSVVIIASRYKDSESITDYSGLGKRSPRMAFILTLGLLSLMGFPLMAGFMGKFYVFNQVANGGLLWLVIIAVINSVISAFYYLRIIRTIWIETPQSFETPRSSPALKIVLFISGIGILLFGILPAILSTFTAWGSQFISI